MSKKPPRTPAKAPQSPANPQEAPAPTLDQMKAANAVLVGALKAVATDLQTLRDVIVKLVGT